MILSWLRRIIRWLSKDDPQARPVHWPTKEEIALLPVFDGLTMFDIEVVDTPERAHRAVEALKGETVVGFDTESKPTFVKGHVSTGPHVAQFATGNRAWIFILHDVSIRKAAATLIGLPSLKKVGFGLGDDLRRIRIKLNIEPQSVLDLENLFKARGYGKGVGVKVGIAMTLKRRFLKSRKASTSNWMRRYLSESQLLYAANDAYAALKAYHELI